MILYHSFIYSPIIARASFISSKEVSLKMADVSYSDFASSAAIILINLLINANIIIIRNISIWVTI